MNRELYPEYPILIVDDVQDFLNSMNIKLKSNGINNVECCRNSLDVMQKLKEKRYSLILLDIGMPGKTGNELLPEILVAYPDMGIIMITAFSDVKLVLECMEKGAMDYLVKPVETIQLIKTIKNTLTFMATKIENSRLKQYLLSDAPENQGYFSHIVTRNKKMLDIFKFIEIIAKSEDPVVITGETGVGKELIAQAIHNASGRKKGLVAVNIAGLDDTLFSDTLFGHKKGAFNDAYQDRDGLIVKAEGSTLLLDEIGDLSLQSQVKLLRLLQEKEYQRLGDDQVKKSNARIVVATNQDLNKFMEEGKFRKDLYSRLEHHIIHIPPLRERKEDIPELVNHFIAKAAVKQGKETIHVPAVLLTLLSQYDFPLNIRELESMISASVTRSQNGIISMEPFYEKIGKLNEHTNNNSISEAQTESTSVREGIVFGKIFPTYMQMKKLYLEEALRRTNNNQTNAAELADLPRTTFINKLKRIADPLGPED